MKPIEIASKLYEDGELLEIAAYCARYGVVHSDDECFFCAYKTSRSLIDTESQQVIENESKQGIDNPDCWYVYIAAGSLNAAFSHIEPMKYIAFRRNDNKFRVMKFDRVRRIVNGSSN